MPSDTPRVSVVMAVYNGAHWLPGSLASVLDQDFRDFELVVVDDCSTDASPQMLQQHPDPRIVYLRNEHNLGQTASLNKGLLAARAPLIARIDADDLWLPGKLAKQVEFLDSHPDIAVLGTWATRIDLESRSLGPHNSPVSHAQVQARLLRGVPVCHVSVVMRRAAVLAAGSYPENYRFAADFALWSTLARSGAGITSLTERLTAYRENPSTFGAQHKLGAAGDEAAEIIRLNARALSHVDLGVAESREIALMFFPDAGLPAESLVDAWRNLSRLQKKALQGWYPRLGLDLWSLLLWGLAKRWSAARTHGAPWGGEFAHLLRRYCVSPSVVAAVTIAALLALVRMQRLQSLKSLLAPLLASRRR
ncbi:MAG: glycosyltransferase family 2 protein [Steroidobacteraceae bacterium]